MKRNIVLGILAVILILPLTSVCHQSWSQTATSKGCLACHSPGSKISPAVSLEEFNNSIHGDLSCLTCHDKASKKKHGKEAREVDCNSCHDKEFQSYRSSVHGLTHQKGDLEAPLCVDCHGNHTIQPINSPKSSVSPKNLVTTCLSCHKEKEIEAIEPEHSQKEFFISYEESVHGRVSPESGMRIAVCSDCHGSHAILPADAAQSLVNKKNIPADCGSCHPTIFEAYSNSIHGVELAKDNEEAPSCTDCHGEHKITLITDPDSRVFASNIPTTCSHCHEAERLSEKFGIPSGRLKTYQDSYHGLALKFGETLVANCASCHGIHDIKPSSDPLSYTHPDNLSKTCGKCHPGAGEKFKIGKVHIEAKPESSLGTFLVRQFYIWFISLLVVGFIIYIVLEALGRRREKRMRKQE
jgi:hypothetical protein